MNVSKISFYDYTKPAKSGQNNRQTQNPTASAKSPFLQSIQTDSFEQNLSFGVKFTKNVDATNDVELERRRFIEKLSEAPQKGRELSEFDQLIIDNADLIDSYGKQGLPLRYSRYEFSKKIHSLLPSLRSNAIQNKMDIQIYKGRGIFFPDYGYEGLVIPNDLANSGREGLIKEECNTFLYKNSSAANSVGINQITNGLIKGMPEFINCIGKKQSDDHDYSVDIHGLMIIANLISDPRYKTLSDDDRFVLKMVALLHDIAKPEAGRDLYHAFRAENICNTIIKRYNMAPEMNERIIKGIGSHQWLRWYNLSDASDEKINEIVEKYQSPTDYTMALMFTRADLAATSKKVYKTFSPLLEDGPQKPLREAVEARFGVKY